MARCPMCGFTFRTPDGEDPDECPSCGYEEDEEDEDDSDRD